MNNNDIIEAQKRAIQSAVLTLLTIAKPNCLPPPDAKLCQSMAAGCLIRIKEALSRADIPMPFESKETEMVGVAK